jgi:hypothetical protein
MENILMRISWLYQPCKALVDKVVSDIQADDIRPQSQERHQVIKQVTTPSFPTMKNAKVVHLEATDDKHLTPVASPLQRRLMMNTVWEPSQVNVLPERGSVPVVGILVIMPTAQFFTIA